MKKKLLLFIASVLHVCVFADSDVSSEKSKQATPDGWTEVNLPNIATITADNTFTITDFGASTSASDNTKAIQDALNAVPSTGGMVVIPEGTWLTDALTVKTKTVLHFAAGATLKQLPYGVFQKGQRTGEFKHLITVSSSDVIIEGESQESSIIDGQGEPWWRAVEDKVDFKRGALIRFTGGQRYLVRNMRFQNAPGTNVTLGQSGKASHMTVHDITISNPDSEAANPSHNTDGIPIWGPYVNIYNCDISTGDDNIVVDSNAHHVHAWNIKCGYGHGMSIGSYTENVHDIIYEDITFTNTSSGFRLKTNVGRSGNDMPGTNSNGAVKNIICRNAIMTGCPSPIKITSWYDSDKQNPADVSTPTAVTYQTPEFCNILFQNIKADAVQGKTSWKHNRPIYLYGRPESYIHDITFDNVQIESVLGMFLAYCKDVVFTNNCKVINKSNTSKPVTTEYEATWSGDFSGQQDDDVKDMEPFFTLKTTASGNVSVPFGTDQDLSAYATITGGSALVHNGHGSKDATMISSSGIKCSNSGGSYIKITLDKAIESGDLLVTEGGDGGFVSLSATSVDDDNIVGNKYRFSSDEAGTSVIYINRGHSKPEISSITISRKPNPSSIESPELTDVTADVIYYDLNGRRVYPMNTSGVLIRNGKKYVEK